jgi:hypothetical protein
MWRNHNSEPACWTFQTLQLIQVQELPFRQVDHEKDVIVETPISFDLHPFLKLNIQLEYCVEKCLAAFMKHQDYMKKVLGIPLTLESGVTVAVILLHYY